MRVPLKGSGVSAARLMRAGLAIRLTAQANADAVGERAHDLLCGVLVPGGLTVQAGAECESAEGPLPNESDVQMWPGQAYRAKGPAANPLGAWALASGDAPARK